MKKNHTIATFSTCKAVVCDLDGTLYLDHIPIIGAQKFLYTVLHSGRQLFYFTNNTSKSRQTYLEKLKNLDFPAEDFRLITATDCTIRYLKKEKLFPDIYLIGNRDLKSEFSTFGFNCVSNQDLDHIKPKAVVLGFDTELNYDKIRTGYQLIQNGIPYIATHADILCPIKNNQFIPDIGTFIVLFSAATGGKQPIVMGKPNKEAVEAICERSALEPYQIAFIGDRLYTDIRMAHMNNMVGILVLSGETSREMAANSSDKPTIIVDSIADLIPALH